MHANGEVIYYGYGGPYNLYDTSTNPPTLLGHQSLLEPGQAQGIDTNIEFRNVSQLDAVLTANNNQSILGPNISIQINGCRAGAPVYDYYGQITTSIAQLIANHTQTAVLAYKVGMYFSHSDIAHATSKNYTGEPNPIPAYLPLYLVPEGPPQHKPLPTTFNPH